MPTGGRAFSGNRAPRLQPNLEPISASGFTGIADYINHRVEIKRNKGVFRRAYTRKGENQGTAFEFFLITNEEDENGVRGMR